MEATYYQTTNKTTGAKGCAATTEDGKHVAVYEGASDGSDDKVVTKEEFEKGWEATPEPSPYQTN